MSNLRTLQKQFRSQLPDEFGSNATAGRLLSRSDFRHAAACERLRIYRNNSAFVVMLFEWKACSKDCLCNEPQGPLNQQGRFGSRLDAVDFLNRCLNSNLSPMDSLATDVLVSCCRTSTLMMHVGFATRSLRSAKKLAATWQRS